MITLKSEQLIITNTDHSKLIDSITNWKPERNGIDIPKEELYERLIGANVVSDSNMPRDVIRLYSIVILRNTVNRTNYDYKLVLPGEDGGLSVFSRFGFELLGLRLADSFCRQFGYQNEVLPGHGISVSVTISENQFNE